MTLFLGIPFIGKIAINEIKNKFSRNFILIIVEYSIYYSYSMLYIPWASLFPKFLQTGFKRNFLAPIFNLFANCYLGFLRLFSIFTIWIFSIFSYDSYRECLKMWRWWMSWTFVEHQLNIKVKTIISLKFNFEIRSNLIRI